MSSLTEQVSSFLVRSALPDPNVQHFAAKRVEIVRKLHEGAETVVNFKTADDESGFEFRDDDSVIRQVVAALDDLKAFFSDGLENDWDNCGIKSAPSMFR